jgi:hypothetical protein
LGDRISSYSRTENLIDHTTIAACFLITWPAWLALVGNHFL